MLTARSAANGALSWPRSARAGPRNSASAPTPRPQYAVAVVFPLVVMPAAVVTFNALGLLNAMGPPPRAGRARAHGLPTAARAACVPARAVKPSPLPSLTAGIALAIVLACCLGRLGWRAWALRQGARLSAVAIKAQSRDSTAPGPNYAQLAVLALQARRAAQPAFACISRNFSVNYTMFRSHGPVMYGSNVPPSSYFSLSPPPRTARSSALRCSWLRLPSPSALFTAAGPRSWVRRRCRAANRTRAQRPADCWEHAVGIVSARDS